MKRYTAQQFAKLRGLNYEGLRTQLKRDAKKDKSLRKYPNAHKCECGHGWIIPDKDLKTGKI